MSLFWWRCLTQLMQRQHATAKSSAWKAQHGLVHPWIVINYHHEAVHWWWIVGLVINGTPFNLTVQWFCTGNADFFCAAPSPWLWATCKGICFYIRYAIIPVCSLGCSLDVRTVESTNVHYTLTSLFIHAQIALARHNFERPPAGRPFAIIHVPPQLSMFTGM